MIAPPRVGCVKYLNARPLIHDWSGPVDFDHPAALCRKLADGELDVALVSSFEYLRNPIYSIVDDVAIAADGAVYSVFVASKTPLADVEEVTLDPASGTSGNLLRCLLAERDLQPRLITSLPNESSKAGRLLIGDQAIRFRKQHGCEYEFWDLAGEWKRLTNLPFVFALWLIRPDVGETGRIANALRRQRDANLAALDEVIAGETEFSPEFCAQYFHDYLRFGFGAREKEGLLLFRALCEKHGILPQNESPLRLV
ncbi:MAG: menaquinone biosynthesis protein [Verrucomicrobiota bacterium]|nr:menaquinone biosynthesis protein [Verrucomicrobiota bacterium]